MPVTRIKNNQITDASAGNTQLGVNAAVKLQNYTVTATKIANNLVYGSDLTVTGNLTVQGNTTTIDTTITTIEDPVIVLASTQTSGAPTVDIGFLGYRGNQSNIAFVWDESASEFVTAFTSTGETNSTITITSYSNFHTNDANVGGNLVVGGNISITGNVASLNVTGNITGGNLLTPGLLSATGNVRGGNFNTAGLVSATGNVTGGNVLTGGLISATSTITSAANITGGNILTGGLVSATANVTGGNLLTGGVVSATANVTGGNVLTGGLISATSTITSAANITGGNLLTGGLISATSTITSAANITGGNLLTGGLISATSNITGGNILFGSGIITGTGNIYGGNIIASNAVIGNVDISGNIQVNSLRSNTIVSAAGNVTGGNLLTGGLISATSNITGGNVLTGGLISATSTITSSANITGGNLLTGGLISATSTITSAANITGGNILTGGVVSAAGNINSGANIIATANVIGGNISTSGLITATGNVTGGNVLTGGVVSATANVTGGNILTGGLISATGTITSAANITGGNILTGGLISATGTITSAANVTGGNLLTGGLLSATANVTGGNLVTGGLVTAAGNVTGGNINTAGAVSATGNITGNNIVVSGNIYDATTMSLVTGSGDIVLNAAGNIDASQNYINNLLDPVLATDAATKQYVDDAVSTGITIHTPVLLETPVALPSATYAQGGNTFTVNQTIAGNTVVFTTAANLQPNDQLWFSNSFQGILANTAYFVVSTPNTSAAVLTTTYDGTPVSNITSATGLTESVRVNSGIGATLTGTANGALTVDSVAVATTNRILVYQQANAVQNGVYVVTQTGNATAPYILTRSTDTNTYGPKSTTQLDAGDYFYVQSGATGAGESYVMTAPTSAFIFGYDGITFTQFSASQVYTANTSAGLSLTGTVFSAKVDNNTTAFDGGGNIIVKAGANLTTPNIGAATGTSLSVTGNVTGGNISTAGLVTATGNVTGGNINTAGVVTATGNVTGGNLLTGGLISATSTITSAANITGGNVLTGGLVSATGNITSGANVVATSNVIGGNISTAGLVTATGNVTGGNILTAGIMSSTGNGIHGNVITGGVVTATGNVTGGNILTGGLISATSTITSAANITGGNILTGGLVSATANVTGGNLVTGGLITATGNVTGGNVLTAGLVSATANVTGGNLLTGGQISATSNITGGNILFGSGIVSGTGNIYANNIFANISGNIDAAGANTQVQFNDTGDILGASAGFTFDKVGNVLTANGNINGANLFTGGAVSATSNITGGNILTGGLISATSTITSAANITGGNLLTGGLISATSTITSAANVIGGNISTAGLVTATGNVTGGNVNTGGLVTATGNVTGGNLRTAGLITATGNITGANLILTSGTIDGPASGRITINGSDIDTDFAVDGDTVANVFYVDAGTGTASFGSSAQTVNAIVAFNATTSILTPVGNTAQRPATGVTGMLRFNTTDNNLEVYNNTQWEAVGVPAFTVIADEQFDGDGSTVAFTLSTSQTTNSCIVSINGVIQIPTLAYSVSTTTLTFTEAPAAGDRIDVRQITTTTTVTGISNSSGNAEITASETGAHFNVKGNLIPTSDATFTLGNASNRWANLFVSGNSIYLGNLILKENPANTFVVYLADGITQANIDVGNVDVSAITSGTSAIGIAGNGYAYVTVNGNSNVLLTSNTGLLVSGFVSASGNIIATQEITGNIISATTGEFGITPGQTVLSLSNARAETVWIASGNGTSINMGNATSNTNMGGNIRAGGFISATGNVIGGNIRTAGAITATGNITGNFIFGNGSQLTGIDATSIQSGTSNVRVVSSGGNVAMGIGGTSNVVVVATTGQFVTGVNSVSGNVTGGNILTAGLISATSTITSAANITGGNILTAGLISATGNISGGNINLTGNIVDTGALSIITGSNGNIALAPNGTGIVTVGSALSATGNITGNFIFGNGSQLTGIDATSIQNGTANVRTFNNGNVTISAAGTANVVVVTSTGTITTGTASVTGNVIGGNVTTAGLVSATGNIIGGNLIINNNATITGNLTVNGTETIFNVANLTVNDKDIIVANNVTGSANVNGAGLQAGNPAVATWFYNNATTSWQSNVGITPSANTTLNLGGASNYWGNAFIVTASISGNVTGGNILTAGLISATGNITGGNLNIVGNIVDTGALSIITGSNGNIALTPNGTGIVTVSSALSVTGNVDGGNIRTAGLISATGQVTGSQFNGSGAGLTSIPNGALTNSAVTVNGTAISLGGSGTVTANAATLTGTVLNATVVSTSITSTGALNSGSITSGFGAIDIGTDTVTCGGIINANGNGVGNIGSSSTYFNTVFAKATSAQYADLAEKYTADADYEPGTVVMFGGSAEVTICGNDACRRVAGVISTNPSYIMNGTLEGDHVATVALTGRVPTRVTGTVRKGDLMVSAGNGRARAEENPAVGTVIGKALADFDGTEGVIEVVVGRL